ncbi:MAG: glycoside hydrolase family 3 N-terminal domain-containing protein, partial [Candidatus Limnocylindrales bacterium]
SIAAGNIGAVILYDLDDHSNPRNIQSREQLRDLTAALKAASEIPVLVSLDAEGGFYHRLREKYGFAPSQSAADMGERNDVAFTRAAAGSIAAELADVGIDMNLAPVVDLMNPVNLEVSARHRSFSSDPAVVAVHAREFIVAHHERGVLTTAKHFPGSGGIVRNDPGGLRESIEGWSEDELEPYRALIGEGLPDAVMATRMTIPKLDPELPACLSPRIVDGLLRRQMGFEGVVISDAMENAAIWAAYGLERGTILAINAGVDMLLLCNINPAVAYSNERGPETVQIIVDAVARGEIAESRINEACGRILALKSRLLA